MIKNRSFEEIYCPNNENHDIKTNLTLTTNKLSVEIFQDSSEETISNYIKNGIFNFGLDLFFGSVQRNFEVIKRLEDAVREESQSLGFQIPLSFYLKLSPRLQYCGRFKRNKPSLHLKLQKQVVLTTNREYAYGSCHSFIYVNAKFLMTDVKKCDIICLGKFVLLQVIEAKGDHVVCQVIVSGIITPKTQVRFPKYIQEAHSGLSAEELEDITFAIGTKISVIISDAPENLEYHSELRRALAELKCNHFHLFTRLTLSCLDNLEDTNWIASAYDGFLIDCSSNKVPEDEIVKLSAEAQSFIEKSFNQIKPIFLQGCWSHFVDRSDYPYAFYYTDKYILPCKTRFLRLFEAVFHKFSQTQFLQKNVRKNGLSTRDLFAQSIVAASLDLQADLIVISSTVGEMAVKMSHFKPKAVIVAITTVKSVVNYMSMYHNIWTLSFDIKDDTPALAPLSHKEDTYQKLVYGIRCSILKKFVDSSGTVLLVFRQHMRYGSTDSFAVVKLNKDYVETIRNVIFNGKI